ncbi:hypothetical protein AVEN_243846-1 [Araneus ventricosus]|uniref:Uncharacterized protein n=1 Tax=Araneus ventricosus TaxID=182803 RepID=A0A4Y2A6R4_ARAVE|nr:hypothetical protein AVEN_243846-1 [Araneus ventricosus]
MRTKKKAPNRVNMKAACGVYQCDISDIVVRSRLWSWRAPCSKRNSTEKLSCMRTWYTLNLTFWGKRPLASGERKLGERSANCGGVLVI